MKNLQRFCLAITLICLLSNCASIVSKSNYEIRVNSVPQDALVKIYNRDGMEVYTGKTPFQVFLKSKAGYFKRAIYSLEFEKEGFAKRTYVLSASLNGWYFGNILFGGWIGMLIVDPLTGAMYRINTVDISLALSASNVKGKQEQPSLTVYDIADIPEEWKSKLIPINNK